MNELDGFSKWANLFLTSPPVSDQRLTKPAKDNISWNSKYWYESVFINNVSCIKDNLIYHIFDRCLLYPFIFNIVALSILICLLLLLVFVLIHKVTKQRIIKFKVSTLDSLDSLIFAFLYRRGRVTTPLEYPCLYILYMWNWVNFWFGYTCKLYTYHINSVHNKLGTFCTFYT